jgi:hyperosmotically inducible periplasmic protein
MRALVFLFALTVASCSSVRTDKDIEKELDRTIRAAAPGVVMTVKNGVVTLSGTCPDESCRHTTETNAKNTAGVKEVVNNIIISTPPAPASSALKQ